MAKKLTFYHQDKACTIVMPPIMGGPQRQGASFQGQGAGLCRKQCRVLLRACDTRFPAELYSISCRARQEIEHSLGNAVRDGLLAAL